MRDDFAIFILTHGRPNKQLTLNALKKSGYTGRYYLVLDNTDTTVQQYIDNYGAENILVFDKNHYINYMDVGTNNPPFKCILYAKQAAEDIAKDLKLSAFVLADDDLLGFRYRYPSGQSLRSQRIHGGIDDAISEYIEFLLDTDFSAVGFGPPLCYFGGQSVFFEGLQKNRLPYNFIFRNASIPVNWVSAYGEDVVTGILDSIVGKRWISLPFVQFDCVTPGSCESGGMSDTYVDSGRFKLAMYDFIYLPTATHPNNNRSKDWVASVLTEHAFPKIISYKYKKEVP